MGPDTSVALEKAALRAKMIAWRRTIPESLLNEMNIAIAGYVIGLPEIVRARHIHLYLSIHSHAEVDTDIIAETLSTMGKELSVPVIMDGKLVSAAFRQGEPLRLAKFGQPEPEVVSIVDESQLDVILIPCLPLTEEDIVSDTEKGFMTGFCIGFHSREGTSAVSVFHSVSRWLTRFLLTNGMKPLTELYMNMELFDLPEYL